MQLLELWRGHSGHGGSTVDQDQQQWQPATPWTNPHFNPWQRVLFPHALILQLGQANSFTSRPQQQHPSVLEQRPQRAYFATTTPTNIEAAMHTLGLTPPTPTWYMDTGATSHMTSSPSMYIIFLI